MKRNPVFFILLAFIFQTLTAQSPDEVLNYTSNVTDTFFGVTVTDKYRWLESLNSDSTIQWLKKQRGITRAEKSKFGGRYIGIYDKLVLDSRMYSNDEFKEGPYYFKYAFTSEYSTPVLFYRKNANENFAPAYDPDASGGKGIESIRGFSVSKDGRYLAVLLSHSGADWTTIKVRDFKKQKILAEKIEWVKFSNLCWTDSGFFYARFKEPPQGLEHVEADNRQQLCFHKLGTLQQDDKVVYAIPERANTLFHFETVAHDRYLILYSMVKLNGGWYKIAAYKDLNNGIFSEMKMFLASPQKEDIDFNVIDFVDSGFVVMTNYEAPRYRVLWYNKDSVNRAEKFIPEFKEVLKSVFPHSRGLFCLYFSGGAFTAAMFDFKGEMVHGIKFEEGMDVGGFEAAANDSIIYYRVKTFYMPNVAYVLNLNTWKTTTATTTYVRYSAGDYATKIVKYLSKDGTEVLMYLTYKKGLKLQNNNPVMLYGYGGFGLSLTPFFNFANILFFENNGILAVPLIRGGGEFGKQWHVKGKGLNKQNSFDDFISAAQYLIDSGYTSKDKLIIRGGSNGGLLVGAVLTQRPDLFKVAIGEMGVYDMLRYHLFTGGRFIQDEFGTVNDSVQFINLLKYSPLQNVKNNISYPATLLMTAENDERVPPFHTYKFLAVLQEKSAGSNPHILYFEEDSGHHGAETFDTRSRAEAFVLAFIFKQLGVNVVTGF